MTNRKANWTGMNWCRQEKRLAIYLRDGLACAYCGHSVEDGAQLTLDHIQPHSKGGTNHESNLVTCCHRCNSARGNRPMKAFASSVAQYLGHKLQAKDIINHIMVCRRRDLKAHLVSAKELISRRGSAAKVLASF